MARYSSEQLRTAYLLRCDPKELWLDCLGRCDSGLLSYGLSLVSYLGRYDSGKPWLWENTVSAIWHKEIQEDLSTPGV